MTCASRRRLVLNGAVQGSGFRPYVYRLAHELGLGGWVRNSAEGAAIEIEGEPDALESFEARLAPEAPPFTSIQDRRVEQIAPLGETVFEILPSAGGEKSAWVLPDIAVCPECLSEMRDPDNRRHRYPFINCTHCGPRFSIMTALPYDRPTTTMRAFRMCPECREEYENPGDRRFHAQPVACPVCGPKLTWLDGAGQPAAECEDALQRAIAAIRSGRIVAVKGLGGFHLIADARNDEAVERLRLAKDREEKPFALMFPSLDAVRAHCEVSEAGRALLVSPEAPIVLLNCRGGKLSPSVAPGNPCLGAMLPYTPLHWLLMDALGFPVVATSGNRAGEPVCIDEALAPLRLKRIAEGYLVHNRPIERHVDDSVVRVVLGEPMLLRRARGYAPLPVRLKRSVPVTLALGGQLKSAVALARGHDVFVSQHIGDLETLEARRALDEAVNDLQTLYGAAPALVVHDRHPDYVTTEMAMAMRGSIAAVQHHAAHVAGCLAEHGVDCPALGVAWDGTGYGDDGEIWGGEFFAVRGGEFERIAWLRPFPLPGGEIAVREPRRTALGLLYRLGGPGALEDEAFAPVRSFSPEEREVIAIMIERGLNCPEATSAGRLFDAAASLADVRQIAYYEGQAAMEWEFCFCDAPAGCGSYGALGEAGELDWAPMIRAMLADLNAGVEPGIVSARFHAALVETIAAVARGAGFETVALSGGCFQNRRLLEGAAIRLRGDGFRPLWPRLIPPNDGGLAFGQIAAVAMGGVSTSMRGT